MIGLWGIIRYLSCFYEESQTIKKVMADLSNKRILDVNESELPAELKELYDAFKQEINFLDEKSKLFEGIVRSTTNLVILKNNEDKVQFVSDSVYKFFGVDANDLNNILNLKEFNEFLNIINELNDNEELTFSGHTFIVRKRVDFRNNTIYILTNVTKYYREIDELRKRYQNLKKYLENIESTIYELTSISNELKSTVVTTSSSLSEQSSALSEISSALDEIRNVVKNLDNALEKINNLIDNIEDNSSENIEKLLEFEKVIDKISDSANTISNEIAALSERAYNVTSFVENIFDIANQTKILAINIAIEAAKSEEGSGKFTVIASEVKELAQKVESLSNDIKKIVTDMTTSVNKTTMTTEESIKNIIRSKEYFNPLKKLMFDNKDAVEKIAKNISDINESFKDHAIGINDIATTIKDISQSILDITKSSEETKASSSIISENIVRLREILKHIDNE
ncbi:methyl-accepting chemotaxis protein [Deferribacter thermophilus]|uniref:methyl-accepting chemotaxis protein n=1 Tax=Deferribacter thermophilus TaxID=53573 RepID=UPI003C169DD8